MDCARKTLQAPLSLPLRFYCEWTQRSKSETQLWRLTGAECAWTQAQILLLEMQASVMTDTAFKDAQRAQMLNALAIADKALVDGADEFLQLLAAASQLQKLANAA